MKPEEIKALSYEEGMEQLEEMVRRLENGGMTLNESFDAYENCILLYNHLESILDAGDARIMKLMKLRETEMKDESN